LTQPVQQNRQQSTMIREISCFAEEVGLMPQLLAKTTEDVRDGAPGVPIMNAKGVMYAGQALRAI